MDVPLTPVTNLSVALSDPATFQDFVRNPEAIGAQFGVSSDIVTALKTNQRALVDEALAAESRRQGSNRPFNRPPYDALEEAFNPPANPQPGGGAP